VCLRRQHLAHAARANIVRRHQLGLLRRNVAQEQSLGAHIGVRGAPALVVQAHRARAEQLGVVCHRHAKALGQIVRQIDATNAARSRVDALEQVVEARDRARQRRVLGHCRGRPREQRLQLLLLLEQPQRRQIEHREQRERVTADVAAVHGACCKRRGKLLAALTRAPQICSVERCCDAQTSS
jgi:hypothetical protein